MDAQDKKILEKRYGTLTPELTELRDTPVAYDCVRITMESTGICWMPVWRILQPDFSLKPAGPYFIKQLPGRKSDVKDAHRISQCLRKDLIRGSFVPDGILRQLRRLTKNRVRLEQQMDNQLQRCNIRFSSYVSGQGNNVSLRRIIKAIIGGERDPAVLNRSVHGRRNAHTMYGTDRFVGKTAGTLPYHPAGWAGLRPRNDESAGRIQSCKTLHGNKYLRQMPVEVSRVASQSNRTFLGKKYRQLSNRMKSQKALLAITRKILVIIFNVLKTGQAFDHEWSEEIPITFTF